MAIGKKDVEEEIEDLTVALVLDHGRKKRGAESAPVDLSNRAHCGGGIDHLRHGDGDLGLAQGIRKGDQLIDHRSPIRVSPWPSQRPPGI
jgi:hypothetical protein